MKLLTALSILPTLAFAKASFEIGPAYNYYKDNHKEKHGIGMASELYIGEEDSLQYRQKVNILIDKEMVVQSSQCVQFPIGIKEVTFFPYVGDTTYVSCMTKDECNSFISRSFTDVGTAIKVEKEKYWGELRVGQMIPARSMFLNKKDKTYVGVKFPNKHAIHIETEGGYSFLDWLDTKISVEYLGSYKDLFKKVNVALTAQFKF